MAVAKDKYEANFTFKIKDQKKDTLSISAIQTGNLKFRERFTLESSTPLIRIANSKINIINNAKAKVPFTTEYDEFNQKLYFDFKKEPLENYSFEILPGALTDFYEKSSFNDSQVISIYYLVKEIAPIKLDFKAKVFDFDGDGETLQAFRWVNIKDLSLEEITFKTDKTVVKLLKEKYSV